LSKKTLGASDSEPSNPNRVGGRLSTCPGQALEVTSIAFMKHLAKILSIFERYLIFIMPLAAFFLTPGGVGIL
jgi:hypothetical protein